MNAFHITVLGTSLFFIGFGLGVIASVMFFRAGAVSLEKEISDNRKIAAKAAAKAQARRMRS